MDKNTPAVIRTVQRMYDDAKQRRDEALTAAERADAEFLVVSRFHDLILDINPADIEEPMVLRSVS